MKVQTRYLEKFEPIKADLPRLLAEFKAVANQLQDVTATGNKVLVQRKYSILKLGEWTKDKALFPYTLEIADQVKKFFDFNSITYRSVQPNTVYNWHTDPGQICYHIPLITNPGCWFVYEDKCFRMPADGSMYFVNNSRHHTFANAGAIPRIHLTFEILI
jgi:hypothetical protein